MLFHNRHVNKYFFFIQSPTAPRATVKFWVLSLLSDCITRQDQAHLPQVTPATALPQPHDAFASPAMGPIKLQFQLSPKSVICLGLKNFLVEAFANQGLSNRGFVSQHFLSCYGHLAQPSLFMIIWISTRRGFSWSVQQLHDRCNTVCHG